MKKILLFALIFITLFTVTATAEFSESTSSNVLEPDVTISVPEKVVTIECVYDSPIYHNDEIKLLSHLSGFEHCSMIQYQWQVNKHDDNGFVNVEGANNATYSFRASSETLSWSWQLVVYYYEEI